MRIIQNLLLVCCLVSSINGASGQCVIHNRVNPDGTMFFFGSPVPISVMHKVDLFASVVTDKEHFFIAFESDLFPPEPKGLLLQDSAIIVLTNQKEYALEFFFSFYRNEKGDSMNHLVMTYSISKSILKDFYDYPVQSVILKIEKDGEYQNFPVVSNKDVIQKQLECLKQER